MPSNSNGENSPSHPQGNQQDTAQQNWFELDGQKVAGETLKAKKWAAERRIVDDASHQGNIHTGTEKSDDLDKSHTPAADLTFGLHSEQVVQSVEGHEAHVVEEIASQQTGATLSEMTDQATPESDPLSSSGNQSTSEVESVVAGGSGSDPHVFEEHFDDSSVQPGSRSTTEKNVGSTPETQPVTPTEAENGFGASKSEPINFTDSNEIVHSSASSEPAAINTNPNAVDDLAVSGHQAQFDGNDTSLVADSSIIADNSEPYTVSLDITPEEQDYGYIISNGGQTHAASGFFVTRGVYGKDSSVYQIGVADENQFIVFQGGEVENGQQTNLTFTYDGQNLTVYQNGIDITDSGSISTRAGRDLPMQNVTLGAPSNVPTLYEFKGETDNVQIYDSTLNATEVGQIQTGVIPDEEGLLVHYTFEGESPLVDQSGNGHDLDNRGNVQISDRVDSKLSTDEDTSLTISADTLLVNDSDVDGDTLSITAVSSDVVDGEGNVVGAAAQDGDGNIVFTPGDSLNSLAEGERENVTFTYTVDDGHGGTDIATVSIAVTGKNDSIGLVTDSDATQNTILENAENGTEIHLTGLAKDVDGDAVTYTLVDGEGNEVRDGAFTIDAKNGVVTLQDSSNIDYETASSHTLHIKATSEDGSSNTSDFNVEVGDVEVIKTTDLGGDKNGTPVTFTLTGDHYDPKNIQDIGAGSPQYHIKVNGEILEVDGQNTFSIEANRGHVEDNHVVRDGNDVEQVTFKVPEGTDIDSISIEFINDAYDYTTDRDDDGITTEDRNLVVKELNIGGTVAEDGTVEGGTTLQAEDIDVSQYIASNGVDVSGREVMPWQGTMTFYPDGVPPEAPVITTIETDNTVSPFTIDSIGDQVDGAGQEVTVTGLYLSGSGENVLENAPELLTINDYREVGDHGYNYMGGHNYFKSNDINTSQLRGGIVTFSDGTKGIIDSASNGIVRDRDDDGKIDYEENAYIYYKAYEGIEESNPTTVDGKAEPYSTIELFDDGIKIGETTTDENGNWTISASLDDGEHNLTSQATDDQGVSSEMSDNTAVLAGQPDLLTSSDSGRSQSDNLTNDQTVTLDGTGASSGETITIYDENGQDVGSGLVDEDGNWSVTTATLSNGNHELKATVTDVEGTESTATESLQVTIDTISPDPPEITAVNEDGGTVYATDDPGQRTGGAANDVTVTGLYVPGSGVNELDDKPELTTDNDYRLVDDHGYNYMGGHDFFDNNGINISQLRGGVITFSDGTAGIIDSVSNGVERDRNDDGVIDDSIVDGVSDYQEDSYIYYKPYDDIKEEQPVTITGTAEVDATVEIFAGETSLGVVQTDSAGNWSLAAVTLSEGDHDITAIATDAAGNFSKSSEPLGHVIDINAVPVIGSVDLGEVLEDTGIKFEASDLLKNSSDVDGDKLVVLDVSVDKEFGSIEYSTDKEGNIEMVKFIPNEDYNGEDVPINFVAADGHVKIEGKASIDVTAVNDAPVITDVATINVTEESMEGFSGYGEVWEGDVYSIITQAEMLNHLGITDVDSDSFTVSLASANSAWHEGIEANDSVFTSDTLDSGASKYDETVVQVTQEFLDNYPTIDAEVGDFYFDHVDFDALAEGETANIQFSVQVSDGESNSEPRDVNIEVTGSNDAPTVSATVNLKGDDEDTSVTFTASELLVHAEDVDVGDSLSISAVSENVVDDEGNVVGTAVQDDDGNIVFTPGDALDVLAEGESQEVQITYTVEDGHGGSASATANITVQGTDNDLTYVSESAGYRNVVGIYQSDDDGNPVSGTVLIDDQNGMVGGTHLADLEPGNYEFFIIANGAGEINSESVIRFDNSGEKPVLLIDGEAAVHPVYFTEPGFNSDGKDHFHFDSDGKGGTYINIEDLPNLGDADFGDVVLHTNFEMDDRTVASTAQLIDGAVEGIEYTTTSGLHGYTEEDGSFSFQEGDDVTFTVGGVTLGVATAEDVSSGQTFLQDIADVDRTDLNDEYLENMATFLQSIDENSDAYDGIVITDDIREALADVDIDLRTASADEVKYVVEQVGKNYVEEDAAMEHVEDMLVDNTGLDHNDFQEHIDDDITNIEQSTRAEQEKENQLSSVASTGFDAVEIDTAAAEVHVADIGDLSLNIPSLDLPGEEQDSSQVAELQQGESVQQEALLQDEVVVADTGGESDQRIGDVVTDDLGQGLPAESLSTLFDDKTEGGEETTSVAVEKGTSSDNSQDSSVAVEEAPVSVEAATAVTSNEPPVVAEDMVSKEDAVSVEQDVEAVTDNLTSDSGGSQEKDDTVLNTDDLHISLAESTEEVTETDNSLDSFSANEDNETPEESSLDEFSATDNDPGMEVEISALDELDVSEGEPSDQVDDTGLNDVDAIQEDLSAEPDQVEVIGVG